MVVVNKKNKMAKFDGASLRIKVSPHAANRAMYAVRAGRSSVQPPSLIKISIKEGSSSGRSISEASVAVSQLLSSILGPGIFLVRLSRNLIVEGSVCVHQLESKIGKYYDISIESLTARSVQSEYFEYKEINTMLTDTWTRKEISLPKCLKEEHAGSSFKSDSSAALTLKNIETTAKVSNGESADGLAELSVPPENIAEDGYIHGVWGFLRNLLCKFGRPNEQWETEIVSNK